jgi:DNA-binding transcriptional LysR family regulator
MDRFSDMRLLVDAAELGSFSAAGRKHGLSPAAASACVLRVEAELGVKLFDRTTRQCRLTDEGRQYVQYCRRALDTMEEAAIAVQAGNAQLRGKLRISAPSDLGRNSLLEMLDIFMHRHPGIQLSLSLSDSVSDLILEEQDVAIRVGRLPDSSLLASVLAQNCRVVCASPECIAAHGAPKSAAQLADLPTLVLSTSAGPQCDWRLGKEVVRVKRYHEATDSEVVRKWALSGHGFAYRSNWSLRDDIRAGRLCLINPERWFDPSPINAIYQRSQFQSARMRVLIDFLREQFATRAA